jgi:catechol 2,3-dioxygenase-like lactoylglutathione lyase family enzyme
MSVLRVQHIGVAVEDYAATCARLERMGLVPRDFRNDQGKGFQHDSRILLGNDCWLHLVHNWNPESRVFRFLESRGQGLEHIALETDDIEAGVERLRSAGVPIFEDRIIDANDGYEAFVFPDDAIGFTVELIQPHPASWGYPDEARGRPLSEKLGIARLRSVVAVVRDRDTACSRFERLFGLGADAIRLEDGREVASIALGNCSLLVVAGADPPRVPEGLERLALVTPTLAQDLEFLRAAGVPLREGDGGRRARVDAGFGLGFTLELGPSDDPRHF